MMATLLLRFAAPMQSWGDESKYDIRQSWREPSKSGVIGLLDAAMGLRRDSDEVARLSSALRMGVRVDMPGRVIMDYQTARPPKYNSKREVRYLPNGAPMMADSPYVTSRYYLCDACFLVGLESPDEALLEVLADSLRAPCFPLYLGRRACPPTLPILLGIRSCSLTDALGHEPWLAPDWYCRKHPEARLRMILETPKGQPAWHSLRDAPLSFSPVHRQYGPRGVEPEQYIVIGDSRHDPMAEL